MLLIFYSLIIDFIPNKGFSQSYTADLANAE